MTFGEKLQRLRRREGLSQEQLAASLGVSRQAVSKWELGEAVPGTENVVEISRLFRVSTDDLLLAERDLPPAAPPPAGEQAPAARPNRALLVAGVCLAALGGLGDLVLWVLSTMVESDLPATSMDGLGRIWYTTQRGYAFWPFIEEHRLQAVLGLCTLSLLAGAALLGAFLWRGRRARDGRVQPGRLRRRYWNRKERGRDLPNGGTALSLALGGRRFFRGGRARRARGDTQERGEGLSPPLQPSLLGGEVPSAALSFIRSLPFQWRGDETGGEPLFSLESPAWARQEELFAAKQARRPPLAQRAAGRRQGGRFPSAGGTVLAAAVKNRAAARLPLSPVAMGKAPPERGGKEGLSVVRPHPVGRPAFRQMEERARRRDRKIERRCAISVWRRRHLPARQRIGKSFSAAHPTR